MLAGALALDLLLGEPPNAFHPVAWLGKVIALLQKIAPSRGKAAQLLYGTGIAVFVPFLFVAFGLVVLYTLGKVSPWLLLIGGVLLFKLTFAVRALDTAAGRVEEALKKGDSELSRRALPALVRRDAANLSPALVASAAVESVAESTTDSFFAPWFYFALFGIAGALAYRAINTLDSMVGYHGGYEYLGKASARLDDLVNFIPSRLAALMIVAGSPLSGADARRAWEAQGRYHNATESPNAGWTMSAMAGALGVALEKPGAYKLGEPLNPLGASSIAQARRIMYAVAAQALLLTLLVLFVRYEIFSLFTR